MALAVFKRDTSLIRNDLAVQNNLSKINHNSTVPFSLTILRNDVISRTGLNPDRN